MTVPCPIHKENCHGGRMYAGEVLRVGSTDVACGKGDRPQGGRPPKSHRTVLKVIWFVLVTGCRWKDVPQEMGCCGETARTRLQAWERAGIWSHCTTCC